jgi:hypothetical protein
MRKQNVCSVNSVAWISDLSFGKQNILWNILYSKVCFCVKRKHSHVFWNSVSSRFHCAFLHTAVKSSFYTPPRFSLVPYWSCNLWFEVVFCKLENKYVIRCKLNQSKHNQMELEPFRKTKSAPLFALPELRKGEQRWKGQQRSVMSRAVGFPNHLSSTDCFNFYRNPKPDIVAV